MEKQKIDYQYLRYEGKVIKAHREISFEFKLVSQLILDELCFNWNKQNLEKAINQALDMRNEIEFMQLTEAYQQYI